MATIIKGTYTKPIPPGAKRVTKKGKRFARFKHKGRQITAPLAANGKKVRIETDEYYVRYKDAAGKWLREKGYTDKGATEERTRQLVARVHAELRGEVDRYEVHRKRPLSEHLDDFEDVLSAKGGCSRHVRQVVNMATRIVEGCGFERIGDIQASRVQVFLGDLRREGLSVQTCKHHLRAIKQFWGWLIKDRRTNDNPISHLEPGNVETDRRRVRRALTAGEVQRLLVAALRSRETYRGLTGGSIRVVLHRVRQRPEGL